jgi:hypothetical protein
MPLSETTADKSLFVVRLRLMGVFLAASVLAQSDGIRGVCLSKALFGLNCPGCGLTRAFDALMHAHIREAALLNPAIFVLIIIPPLQVLVARRATKMIEHSAPRLVGIGDAAVSAAFLCVLSLRVLGVLPTP